MSKVHTLLLRMSTGIESHQAKMETKPGISHLKTFEAQKIRAKPNHTMSEPTDLTPLQAREIVLDIAEGKGWVEQRIRNKTDPDTLRLLRTIEKIREDLGDAVEKYVDKCSWI